jgi:hypothetical protein
MKMYDCAVVSRFSSPFVVVPLLGAANSLKHAVAILFVLGFFSIFLCVAMLMRTGMAKGSGVPIPDDSSADVLTKAGRSIARGERSRVPLYRRIWQGFLGLGVVLLLAACLTLLVSHL